MSLDIVGASACPLLQHSAQSSVRNRGYFCSSLQSHGINLPLSISMALSSSTQLGFQAPSKSHWDAESTDAPTLFGQTGRAWDLCSTDLLPSASSSSSSGAPGQPWLCSLLERGWEKHPQPML